MIPNKGNLSETAPLKLLLVMDEHNQTGILYFRKNEILKVFYLNQGKISWAISSDEEDKIEHILLAKKLVNPDALAPFLAGNKISETFGKILVENGLISLETLINASRDQLMHIATSVLFWNSGSYQLESESPPTRLVSLELEIAPLVYNYILAHMDVNIIWEEIGSLSGELQQSAANEKIFQYNLDAEQQEVFNCFREPQRPETVLLRFPAERKHTILKILYFLVVAGLLVKKEADIMAALNFNELDSLFGHEQPEAPVEVNVEIPPMINETEIKDIPIHGFPEAAKSESITEVSLSEIPELEPKTDMAPKVKPRETPIPVRPERRLPRIQPLLPEKQKSRWVSVSFISLALAAVVIALFMWFNRATGNPELEPVGERPVSRARQKPAVKPDANKAEQILKAENGATEPDRTTTQAQAQAPVEKKANAPLTTTPAGKKAVAPTPTVPATDAEARKAFSAGRFSAAGDLWRRELVSDKFDFSILLEMDCLEQSVNSAYGQVTDKENFFILNRVKAGRTCWLVLWGKFRTQNEAQQNLKLIPEYFFKQSEPPTVVELAPYL
ncbi:MAG: hypothetical protein NTW95_08790 [Candidatus Aminicenantes bacterium]|nr:hypothetical protein [Candidatus Aminicenantes bacterium]